jgi:hypothetical protein
VDDHVQVGSFDDGGCWSVLKEGAAKHEAGQSQPLPPTALYFHPQAPPDTSRRDGKDTVRLAPKTDAQVTSDKSADRVRFDQHHRWLPGSLAPSLSAVRRTRCSDDPQPPSLLPERSCPCHCTFVAPVLLDAAPDTRKSP